MYFELYIHVISWNNLLKYERYFFKIYQHISEFNH